MSTPTIRVTNVETFVEARPFPRPRRIVVGAVPQFAVDHQPAPPRAQTSARAPTAMDGWRAPCPGAGARGRAAAGGPRGAHPSCSGPPCRSPASAPPDGRGHASVAHPTQARTALRSVALNRSRPAVPTLVVVESKFGQTDHEVPVLLASPVLQPAHRGVDVFRAGGERLTHNGERTGLPTSRDCVAGAGRTMSKVRRSRDVPSPLDRPC